MKTSINSDLKSSFFLLYPLIDLSSEIKSDSQLLRYFAFRDDNCQFFLKLGPKRPVRVIRVSFGKAD